MSEIRFFLCFSRNSTRFYIVLFFKILKTYKETYLVNFTNSDGIGLLDNKKFKKKENTNITISIMLKITFLIFIGFNFFYKNMKYELSPQKLIIY